VPNPATTTDDADARTTQVGLYNLACSYHQAARALKKLKLRTTHPTSPVSFLYFHAIELFLKSFLRMHGHTVAELRKKFSHGFGPMRDRAAELGLDFMDEDLVVLAHNAHAAILFGPDHKMIRVVELFQQ
jgi:hypothetical protein